ncbi:MAG: rubredoxin [Bacteroidales bacterium]|nr:rubredoxin [Bacteroidales bacterium]
MKYKCKICGYVYDPDIGDPSQMILPQTIFEELPSGWVCPICDAPKEDFFPIN